MDDEPNRIIEVSDTETRDRRMTCRGDALPPNLLPFRQIIASCFSGNYAEIYKPAGSVQISFLFHWREKSSFRYTGTNFILCFHKIQSNGYGNTQISERPRNSTKK